MLKILYRQILESSDLAEEMRNQMACVPRWQDDPQAQCKSEEKGSSSSSIAVDKQCTNSEK
jgi:hypothetical protein